jgi:site-specific DNA-adenine methylase
METPDFGDFTLADPLTLKTDFLEIENLLYLGSKRRLKEQFAKLVPEDVKTVFDPMCGSSLFLAELAKRGKTIIANDYSTAPFMMSRAIFSKSKPGLEEFKAFVDSVREYEGYYFTNAKKLFPIVAGRIHTQKFIDGYIHQAHGIKHGDFYLGVLAGCLLYWWGAFGGPYRKWSFLQFKKNLFMYYKQLSKFDISGTVTNSDALKMDIPNVDMIYFDPPYSDKQFKYVSKYGKLNSILLQKDWGKNEITQEEVAAIAEKLSKHCKYLFISTNSGCPIQWKKLFGRSNRQSSRKKFTLTGSDAIASNLSGAEKNKRQIDHILWVSVRKSEKNQEMDEATSSEDEIVEKAKSDPFMIYPDESANYKYMMHSHFIGKGSHFDLRMENLDKKFLIGWTLFAMREGTIKEPVLTLADGRKINADSEKYYKINLQTGEWATREKKGAREPVRIELVASRKTVGPVKWMDFEGVTKPGVIGGTKTYPGVFLIVDKGKVEYLSQKDSGLHEYWFDGKVLKNGRYLFRQLKAWSTKKSNDGNESGRFEIIGSGGLWEYMKKLNHQTVEVLKLNGMTDKQIQEWIEPQLAEAMKEMNLSKEEIQKAFIIPPGKEEGLGPEVGWLFINPDDQVPYVLSARAIDQKFLPLSPASALPKHWRDHVAPEEEYWVSCDKSVALERRKNLVERWKEEGIIGRAEKGDRNPFKKSVEKARHRHDQCMECSKPPDLEILWADGRGHAWFCWPCFVKWVDEEEREVISAKLVKDGEASKKYADNHNPVISDQVKEFISSKNAKGTIEEFKAFVKWLTVQKAATTDTEFHLTYQFWKGQKVAQNGSSMKRFLLWVKNEKKYLIFQLNDNILSVDEINGMLLMDEWGEDEYIAKGYVKPGGPLNPTKDVPSFIRSLDSGKVIILTDEPDLKKIQLDGKELNGVFLFEKAEDHWTIEKVKSDSAKET